MTQAKNAAKISLKSIDSPAVDWNLCLKLANNKSDLAQEILLFVIQQLPEDIRAIKQAQDKGDYAEELRCAHKLHGALCYSGMPRLKNVVAEMETLLKNSKFDKGKLLELTKQLDEEVAAVLASPLGCEE